MLIRVLIIIKMLGLNFLLRNINLFLNLGFLIFCVFQLIIFIMNWVTEMKVKEYSFDSEYYILKVVVFSI